MMAPEENVHLNYSPEPLDAPPLPYGATGAKTGGECRMSMQNARMYEPDKTIHSPNSSFAVSMRICRLGGEWGRTGPGSR